MERNAAMIADAPHSSFEDLVHKYSISKGSIARILCNSGVRIGLRSNMRRGLKANDRPGSFKQLKIVAYLRDNGSETLQEVGERFHVTREFVSQIRCKARELKLL